MKNTFQLKNVCRQYQLGGIPVIALNDITLEIEQGEFVALVGPSGSGKSTLLNLLGGLDRPTSGEIILQDIELHTATEKELTDHRRDNVGFVFQTFNLLPQLTALENVALPMMLSGIGLAERQLLAGKLLERVGLKQRVDHRPAEMSGGEQQRAAIARALVNDPTLILADEPTGNLDTKIGAEVMTLMQELNTERGVTLVIVTHDPEVASYADRIVHLRDGEISEISVPQKPKKLNENPANVPGSKHNGRGGLSFRDLLRTAFENLRRRPVRNALTAAGILIGIITLVAMVSFGVGVQNEVNRSFETLGLENVIISPAFPEEEVSFDPFGIPQPLTPLTPAIADVFRAMPEVNTVTPVLTLPSNIEISLSFGEQAAPIYLSDEFGSNHGGPPGSAFVDQVLAGERLGEGETEGVVLVQGLADILIEETNLDYADLVGETVTLTVRLPRGETDTFSATIVGVREGRGERRIDLGLAERIEIKAWWFGRPDTLTTDGYDSLIVRAVDQTAVPAVAAAAEEQEVEAQSLASLLAIANQVLAIMQALLGSVGGLALLVATLGVANTMMMAIYERTREIGVLKAVGASSKEVRRMFTADAMLLGIIGGFFGVIFGTLLGRLVDWIGHQYLAGEGVTGIGQMSVVPLWLAIGALVFASLIGVLGGLYPAARAARLDPVAALRHG
jgi:ABC-type lipoprotein export system ATPase subunit/ABC-type lipoprotein release transport system permease subunit